ncbi:MAG TPA: glutamate formiminotransferase [Acidimicrobiia bacterium]|nr:glutamate formiminotransferase [Acidimicrobiia bacterium]
MFEAVINISEGRDAGVVAAVAAAAGRHLLDVHTDPDHHRSVLTLAGPAADLAEAARAVAREAVARIDLGRHAGVHPRLGAIDVVPFVPLGPAATGDPTAGDPTRRSPTGDPAGPGPSIGLVSAANLARRWAGEVAAELALPVFLYDAADPAHRSLPDTRRAAFRERAPDFGPAVPHPTAGAVAVGARPVLVALNCEVAPGVGSRPDRGAGAEGAPAGGLEADLAVARAVARAVRERDGGLPGVRALGFALASRGRAQVSMNLVDLAVTGVEEACRAVRRAASERGRDVAAVELVGLLPAAELERCRGEFLTWSGLGPDRTIEARLDASGLR